MNSCKAIHHKREAHPDTSWPDPHQDTFSKSYLGFWIYLMTDCLLFGALFTTYAVLHNNTFGGPGAKDLFQLPTAFLSTLILLSSSLTCGLAVLASLKKRVDLILFWLSVTFLLGGSFIFVEFREFQEFIQAGHSWRQSAFLSSFFTIVGTHGLHVIGGLLWLAVVGVQLLQQGLTTDTFRRLVLFSLFWHFLDLVWIFIFTFVYLMGVI